MIVNYACRSLDNLLDRAKTNALTGVFPALGRLDPVVIPLLAVLFAALLLNTRPS